MPPHSTFLQEIRSLSRPVWILSAGLFVDRFGTFVMPFLVLFLAQQGIPATRAAQAFISFGAGSIGASFLGGYLADRIGRRRTMAISLGSSAFVALGVYWSAVTFAHGGLWLVLLGSGLYGLARGMNQAASSSLVADLVPGQNRVAAFSLIRFAINAGWGAGMAAGGFISEYSFLALFVIDASTSAVFALVALFFLPHGHRARREESGWAPAFRVMSRNRRFLLLALNTFIVALLFNQYHSSFAVFLQQEGYEKRIFGWVLALNGLLIALFEMPISAAVRRRHPPLVIGLGTALLGIGFSLNAWFHTLPGLFLAMSLFTLGEMISMPMQGAYLAELSPESMRGRCQGMMGLVWATAATIGPSLGISLLLVSPKLLAATAALLGLLGGALMIGRAPAASPAPAPAAPPDPAAPWPSGGPASTPVSFQPSQPTHPSPPS